MRMRNKDLICFLYAKCREGASEDDHSNDGSSFIDNGSDIGEGMYAFSCALSTMHVN